MAKRRNTAALFEVFHDTRGPASTAASPVMSAVRNLSTWFRSRTERDSSSSTEPADPNDPTTRPIKSPLIVSREVPVETVASPAPAKPQPTVAAAPAPATKVEPAQQKTVVVAKAPAAEKPQPVAKAPASDPQTTQPASNSLRHSHFHLDRDRREVTLRLRFTTAVVVCFGIVLTVALSYVLGRRAGARPTVLAAETQTDPHYVEVKPSALDIPRRPAHVPAAGGTSVKPPAHAGTDANGHDHEPPQPNTPRSVNPPPPAAADDGKREIGLNYFVISAYPDEAGAAEARDFLKKNGVDCTVEKSPFKAGWFAVITLHGFDRDQLHSTECEHLRKQIEKLGETFAGNTKWKRFTPTLKKLT